MINENALQTLRDIHLPNSVSIWPIAPGWYILLGLFFIFVLMGWFYYRYSQGKKYKYGFIALQELERIHYRRQEKNSLIALSALLRRTALAIYPRHEVAGLHGEAWLQFLDKTSKTTAFTEGAGHVLITAPYQDHVKVKLDIVFELVETWIKQVCK